MTSSSMAGHGPRGRVEAGMAGMPCGTRWLSSRWPHDTRTRVHLRGGRPTGARISRCGRWRRCSGSRSLRPTASSITSHRCWPSRRPAGRTRTPFTSSTHPGADPRPEHRRLQQELPVLDQPAGRHRRQQPSGRGDRSSAARQPQRLPGVHGVRCRPGAGPRLSQMAATKALAFSSRTANGVARSVSARSRRPRTPGPSTSGTRPVPTEELEDPAGLPTQGKRWSPGHARHRPATQPGRHRITHAIHGAPSSAARPPPGRLLRGGRLGRCLLLRWLVHVGLGVLAREAFAFAPGSGASSGA